jgi:UDP-N-acetylmuramyl pentapeptide phosphotransferase/UDP-N-acetylglucosamine-1-phosphate transferase
MLPYLSVFGVAFGVSVALVVTQSWHGRFSLDSMVGVQKFHTEATPRIGGVAIALGLAVAWLLAAPGVRAVLGPMLLAGSLAFAFGLVEDLTKRVSVRARLLATMASGVLGWALTGQMITDVDVPGLDWLLSYPVVAVAFTAFAVGGVANAINIIDGFNGLASGAVIIILSSFALIAFQFDDIELTRTSFLVISAVLGFGLVNWPLGKLFLGDGGAYFVGFNVAWLAVLLLARHAQVSAWAPLLVCGFPVLEVLFSVVRRWRRGSSPGNPDCLHLHSLVKRRLVRRLAPHASHLMRNSLTGSVIWGAALLPTLIAVKWPTNTPVLMLGLACCALLYCLAYARLTQFRWCLTALTMRPASTTTK